MKKQYSIVRPICADCLIVKGLKPCVRNAMKVGGQAGAKKRRV